MEVLTDEVGDVGILLTKKEAIILRRILQIDNRGGYKLVEDDTEYSLEDAKKVEYELWNKLDNVT